MKKTEKNKINKTNKNKEYLFNKMFFDFITDLYLQSFFANQNLDDYRKTLGNYIEISSNASLWNAVVEDTENLNEYIKQNGMPEDIQFLFNKYMLERG